MLLYIFLYSFLVEKNFYRSEASMAVGPPGSLVEMVGRPALLVLAGAILARGQLIGQRGVIGLPGTFHNMDSLEQKKKKTP